MTGLKVALETALVRRLIAEDPKQQLILDNYF